MFESFQRLNQELQRVGKDGFNAPIRYDGAQSRAEAIQAQSQIVKKALDICTAEMSKLTEMYMNMIRNTQTG